MGRNFSGSTEEAGGPFLGSDFWKKGTRIEGTITGSFATDVGVSYNAKLNKAVTVNGEKVDRVSIGGLKGLAMALRASGANEFHTEDAFVIECTGTTPTDKGNDQINFRIVINRN